MLQLDLDRSEESEYQISEENQLVIDFNNVLPGRIDFSTIQ